MEEQNRKRKIKFNKRIIRRNILIVGIIILICIIIKFIIPKKKTNSNTNTIEVAKVSKTNIQEKDNTTSKEQLDWKLTLVNQSNKLPENYEMKLLSIDEYRKFDSRAMVLE